jgi:DNA polymerase-3 subunit delta
VVITLAGDDDAAISARFDALLGELLPGDARAFNLLELDGAQLTIEALRSACDSVAFFGGVRVVVVKGLLRRFGEHDGEEGKGADAALLKGLKEYLPRVPETTTLIFVERRRLGASAAANALRRASSLEEHNLPSPQDLPAHIQARARERGATLDRDAAALLAEAVATEPRRLESELEKLLAFAGEGGRVSVGDVRDLVDVPLEVAVWDLTDALYAHDARGVVRSLRALLERGQAPQQVMGAVASQLRNLVVAEEHKGSAPDRLASATGMKPFVARKSLGALRNFGPGEPRRLLAALLDLDLRSKTGKADLAPALELLLVSACARRV